MVGDQHSEPRVLERCERETPRLHYCRPLSAKYQLSLRTGNRLCICVIYLNAFMCVSDFTQVACFKDRIILSAADGITFSGVIEDSLLPSDPDCPLATQKSGKFRYPRQSSSLRLCICIHPSRSSVETGHDTMWLYRCWFLPLVGLVRRSIQLCPNETSAT